jgi:hypothetical protein
LKTGDLFNIGLRWQNSTGGFQRNPWIPSKVRRPIGDWSPWASTGELRPNIVGPDGSDVVPEPVAANEEDKKAMMLLMPEECIIFATGGGKNVKASRSDHNSIPCARCDRVDKVRATEWRARKIWKSTGGFAMVLFRVYKCDGGCAYSCTFSNYAGRDLLIYISHKLVYVIIVDLRCNKSFTMTFFHSTHLLFIDSSISIHNNVIY